MYTVGRVLKFLEQLGSQGAANVYDVARDVADRWELVGAWNSQIGLVFAQRRDFPCFYYFLQQVTLKGHTHAPLWSLDQKYQFQFIISVSKLFYLQLDFEFGLFNY